MVKTYGQEKDRTVIIRKRLAEAFEEHDVSLKKVADFCGVTPQAVLKWQRSGKIARDNVPKIASFFGKRPEWLLDDHAEELRESAADYLKEPIPDSFRELLDTMDLLPTAARHDIHNLIRNLAKAIRHGIRTTSEGGK